MYFISDGEATRWEPSNSETHRDGIKERQARRIGAGHAFAKQLADIAQLRARDAHHAVRLRASESESMKDEWLRNEGGKKKQNSELKTCM